MRYISLKAIVLSEKNYEKQIIMEIQKREQTRKTSPKPVNEVQAFDRLLRDVADY